MANKITYKNKAPLQNDETIPEINKVNANDMNEIKKLQAKDKEKDNIIQSLIKRIETLEKGVNK